MADELSGARGAGVSERCPDAPGDGGPVFPGQHLKTVTFHGVGPRSVPVKHPGMSLRDWFAGQALSGMMAVGWSPDGGDYSDMALTAYVAADAMLAERAKGGK